MRLSAIVAVAAVAAVAMLAACATPAERFEQRAAQLGFSTLRLNGDDFDHLAFVNPAGQQGAALHVYIEHDGTPWASIDRVAEDPTPRTPFALELMARDTGPRLLLGRPCYFQARAQPPCGPAQWTHERYSPRVVASMAAALRRYLAAHPFRHLVLVGYSGGGTLAWLMAARLPETTAVVTIAANLDIDEWARLHGYSLMRGSLNPAALPPLPAGVVERHYVGTRDANVPPAVVRSFARHHPGARVIEVPGFDHVCCWVGRWPELLGVTRDAQVPRKVSRTVAPGDAAPLDPLFPLPRPALPLAHFEVSRYGQASRSLPWRAPVRRQSRQSRHSRLSLLSLLSQLSRRWPCPLPPSRQPCSCAGPAARE